MGYIGEEGRPFLADLLNEPFFLFADFQFIAADPEVDVLVDQQPAQSGKDKQIEQPGGPAQPG